MFNKLQCWTYSLREFCQNQRGHDLGDFWSKVGEQKYLGHPIFDILDFLGSKCSYEWSILVINTFFVAQMSKIDHFPTYFKPFYFTGLEIWILEVQKSKTSGLVAKFTLKMSPRIMNKNWPVDFTWNNPLIQSTQTIKEKVNNQCQIVIKRFYIMFICVKRYISEYKLKYVKKRVIDWEI